MGEPDCCPDAGSKIRTIASSQAAASNAARGASDRETARAGTGNAPDSTFPEPELPSPGCCRRHVIPLAVATAIAVPVLSIARAVTGAFAAATGYAGDRVATFHTDTGPLGAPLPAATSFPSPLSDTTAAGAAMVKTTGAPRSGPQYGLPPFG